MSEMPPSSYTPPPPGGGSYTPPPPPPPPVGGLPPGPPSSDRTLMIVLAWLWLLGLIPLLTKKDDPEVQWQAKNGLTLFGVEIACWILFMILGGTLGRMIGIGCGIATIQCVIWLVFLVVRIMALIKGVGGQRMRIPVVSDLAEKW
ncbi:MAG: hypothetical protein JWO97_1947 [Acidobacteria bacterium]|nr:hypothetical protein [Acidobacteriota bacterium]